jgi:hypothetical protein
VTGQQSTPRGDAESEDVLRAKYHDYCSAQLAEILLYLSPDQTYQLAQTAAREAGDPGEVSYLKIAEIARAWLSKKVALPPFEVWVSDYREHPDRYEEYFLGLWALDAGTVAPGR